VNDLRRRLERAGRARLQESPEPDGSPSRLRPRARRRQATTVAIAAAIALVVGIVLLFGTRAALHRLSLARTPPAVPTGNRTSTLYGIQVTYPRDWTLLQLPGGTRGVTPLLELASFEPPAAAGFGCTELIPSEGVVLVVARGGDATGLGRKPLAPQPPTSSCSTARWAVRGHAFQAWLTVGPDARASDRTAALEAFRSLRFPPAISLGLRRATAGAPGPALVVASGYQLGKPSSYVAWSSAGSLCFAVVVAPANEAPCEALDGPFGDVRVIRTGPWAVVVGEVSTRVASVEAELAGGQTLPGEVLAVPAFLDPGRGFFSVELPVRSRGDIVVRDDSGNVLATTPFDPPPLPVIIVGGPLGRQWTLIDREQSNGIRCIDYDRGFGDIGGLCPAAVPGTRAVDATVVDLPGGRKLVYGVLARGVHSVRVQFLNGSFARTRIRDLPPILTRGPTTLPSGYRIFTVPVAKVQSALVVAFDREGNVLDGMPLGSDVGFGE
jgi:hypothetical protein